MDTLKRYYGGVKRTFYIYSQEEADEMGLKYVPWRDAKQDDWALSDDGYVGECLKITGPYKPGGALEHIFSFARVWGSKSKLNYLERKATRSYSLASAKHWAEHEVVSTRAKRFILAYVMMFMAGNGIDWAKLGQIYRPGDSGRDPAKRARHLFKQEAFQRMIQEKMVEVFKAKDLSEGDVIDMFKEAYDLAKKTKNVKEMREVAEDFRDMLDMLPERHPGKIFPFEGVEWHEGEIEENLEDAKKLTGAAKALPK